MSKYIDLVDRITEDFPPLTGPDIATLRWLDEHPEQVPGRTIAESEFDEIAGTSSPARREDFRRFLKRKYFTVVPDPEPTNAEKLAALMYEADEKDTSTISGGWEYVADFLDKAGVQAQEVGGNDE